MTELTAERVSYESASVTEEQLERLNELFPQCVREGKLDFDVVDDAEHFRRRLG